MRSRSISDRAKILWIRRLLIYGALTLLLCVAQCSFFASLHILPATPDLVLGLVVCVLLFDSPKAASVVSLCAGTLLDALGTSGFFLSPVYYFVICLILFLPASKMLPRFVSFCVLLVPTLAIRALFTLLCMTLYLGKLPALSLAGPTVLFEMLMTAIFCLPFYPLFRLCRKPLSVRRALRR